MKKLNKFQNAVYMLGALLLLVGASLYITRWIGAFYMYTAGACCFSVIQFMAGYEGKNWTPFIMVLPSGMNGCLHCVSVVCFSYTLLFEYRQNSKKKDIESKRVCIIIKIR